LVLEICDSIVSLLLARKLFFHPIHKPKTGQIKIKKMKKRGLKRIKILKETYSSADISTMREKDRRKYPRINSSNLITYCCLDENEKELGHYMAQALEVSPVGVKIESTQEIESEMVRLISVDSEDTLIDVKGRVVHSRKTQTGRYLIGICLAGTQLENTRFVLKLLAVCQQTKQMFHLVKGVRGDGSNRRGYPRIDTNNLVSYSCLDENGNELNSCMAMALDINPLGAKIETYQEIVSDIIWLTSVDEDDNLIGILGRVAHSKKADDGKYEIGIQFLGTQDENTDFALKLINVFHKCETTIVMEKKARY